MATRINKEAIDELISELYQTGFGWEEISNRIQEQYPESRVKTAAGASTRYYRYLNSLKSDTPLELEPTNHPEIVYDPNDDTFELPETPQMLPLVPSTNDYRKNLEYYLGTTLDTVQETSHKLSKNRKVVIVSDLHGNPSQSLIPIIIDCNPDIIVIAGDLYDSQAINPHGIEKDVAKHTMREESARIRAWIEVLLLHTSCISLEVMTGNHDIWMERTLSELLPPSLLEYFNDPIDVLLAELPKNRVHKVIQQWQWNHAHSSLKSEFGQTRFLYVLGDILVSHANFTDKFSGGAVRKLWQWLSSWQQPLGLSDIRVLVQAHTHKMSLNIEIGGHQAWIECGMAAEPEVSSYQVVYNTKWRPGTAGAVYLEQEEQDGKWITQFKTIKLLIP